MHSATINRDQAWAGSTGAGSVLLRRLHGIGCQPASDHREFYPARHATSLVRRRLGRGFGSGRFLRLNDIAELRRVGISGADPRAAAFNLQCTHQPAVQAFADLAPRFHSSKSLPSSSTYASKIAQKRGQDHGNLSQGRGNFSRGEGGAGD